MVEKVSIMFLFVLAINLWNGTFKEPTISVITFTPIVENKKLIKQCDEEGYLQKQLQLTC